MSHSARSHEENRNFVCFYCFHKSDTQVTKFIIEKVQTILNTPIDLSDSLVPNGVC